MISTNMHREELVKTFDAVTAIGNNLFSGSLKEKIFYLHIYKCGGTSISQAIKSCYYNLESLKSYPVFHLNREAAFNAYQTSIKHNSFLFNQDQVDGDYLKWKLQEYLLLYYMGQEHINYIAGHFSFSAIAYQHFSDKYKFITVLRDPVKRYISAYFYSRYKQSDRSLNMEITEYLKSRTGLKGGSMYVKLLGGLDEAGDYTSEKAINRAKENLHKFSVVGCLEYQKDFLNQFEKQFDRKLNVREFNQNPKSKTYRKSVVSEELEAEIRAICQPDIEIYQYALENFVQLKN